MTVATMSSSINPSRTPYFQTKADSAPVTRQRPVPLELNSDELTHPGVPRASEAADVEHPRGSIQNPKPHLTVLQQHVAFFDRNHDGIIYPWETFAGFRALGFNLLIAFNGMLIIHLAMAYSTQESWIPSPWFELHIKNIHRAKHGSDTGVYDTEGRFIPQKFEELFTKYAKTSSHHMTWYETLQMTEAIRNAMDPFGWTASKLEFGVLLLLCAYRDARFGGTLVLTKEHIRSQYDGTLFYRIEHERKEKRDQQRQQQQQQQQQHQHDGSGHRTSPSATMTKRTAKGGAGGRASPPPPRSSPPLQDFFYTSNQGQQQQQASATAYEQPPSPQDSAFASSSSSTHADWDQDHHER